MIIQSENKQELLSLDILAECIRMWADNRSLLPGNPSRQFQKLIEEVGELAGGMARQNTESIIDAIGDCFVVLTILATQHGFDIETCVNSSWSEIKERKGKMVDGVFIKEGD